MSLTTADDDPTADTATLPPPIAVVRSAGLSDPGRVRARNEDHFLIAELGRALWVRETSLPQEAAQAGRRRSQLFLVADGMGGAQAGEVASALSVATVEDFVLHFLRRVCNVQSPGDEQTVVRDLQEAVHQADARILAEAAHHPECTGMGTTLTLAFVNGTALFVVHAGDSRCYLFRDGSLRRLTEDHTVAADLARRGLIRSEDVPRHGLRHVLTNVLGGGQVGVQVDVERLELHGGDVLLLCSDGLTDMVTDDEVAAVLAAAPDPRAACRRLVDEANAHGGRDNITTIVARFDPA